MRSWCSSSDWSRSRFCMCSLAHCWWRPPVCSWPPFANWVVYWKTESLAGRKQLYNSKLRICKQKEQSFWLFFSPIIPRKWGHNEFSKGMICVPRKGIKLIQHKEFCSSNRRSRSFFFCQKGMANSFNRSSKNFCNRQDQVFYNSHSLWSSAYLQNEIELRKNWFCFIQGETTFEYDCFKLPEDTGKIPEQRFGTLLGTFHAFIASVVPYSGISINTHGFPYRLLQRCWRKRVIESLARSIEVHEFYVYLSASPRKATIKSGFRFGCRNKE